MAYWADIVFEQGELACAQDLALKKCNKHASRNF